MNASPPFDAVPAPLTAPREASARRVLRQDWVLSAPADWLLIIAAPLLILAAALGLFRLYGTMLATTLILTAHVVFTVAHHLPTFLRVYGDVELFRRYRWRFLLAPVLPLMFAVGVLVFLGWQHYPLEYFLYLYILLALWDPWHFLRQHFGFMRIYDRLNAAPQRLAARMDWWLCASWFLFIMVSSGAWLATLLEDLENSVAIPALRVLPWQWLPRLTDLLLSAALVMSLAYAGYLLWCKRHGYFISAAKLALCAATFGSMYLAYAPNHWMLSLAPAWSFQVGFAAIGLVHMTQYLALVWRYNRRLTAQPPRARRGWFTWAHARGGWWMAATYVVLCLTYGEFMTKPQSNAWLMSVLLALGFTSTFLHYYFDGFIWKVRHRQNQENLGAQATFACWWSTAQRDSAGRVLARQLLYFAVPLGALTLGAVSVWRSSPANSVAQMQRAQRLSESGAAAAAKAQAQAAFVTMQARLPVLAQLTQLDPSAARQAELAYLIYNYSYYTHVVLPALAGETPSLAARYEHDSNIAAAVKRLADARHLAVLREQPLGHAGREQLSLTEVEHTLAAWERLLDRPTHPSL